MRSDLAERVKIAIVAAIEREIKPLVRNWVEVDREYEGRSYKFFESNEAVLVCGGIGPAPARRATEAVITLYKPYLVQSVGFAGALDGTGKVGDVVVPSRVVDATDGSSFAIDNGQGTLVSIASTAAAEQKAKLAVAYRAQFVDMEAAAVARGAEARGIAFGAMKVISDEMDFALPELDRFVSHDGQFKSGRFVLYSAIRPWLWTRILKLARHSSRAAHAMCRVLEEQLSHGDILKNMNNGLHPIATRK